MAQFKLSLLCNDIPTLPAHDGGIWRRMEIIEFKSEFVDNPRDENQFKKDYQLEDKMPMWKEIFMAMLIDIYYRDYKLHGIRVPGEVSRFTDDIKLQSDNYGEFMNMAIVETKDRNDKIEIVDLYDEFRLWYVEENNDMKVPDKKEYKKYLNKKYKKLYSPKEACIKGIKFREDYQKKTQGNQMMGGSVTNVVGSLIKN